MRIAVIGAGSRSGERGGAELFYQGLVGALNSTGMNAELLCPISDESSFEAIEETYLKFYDLDLSTYDGVISTKAPAYIIRHPNHICYLQHTMRVFYDMFDFEFPNPSKVLLDQRDFIQRLDTLALQYPRTKKVFTIGNEVKNRLLQYNGIESEVLYQGLLFDNFREGNYDYIFMPGRLHRWKRVDLVIGAMKYVKSPVRLVIAGTGEDGEQFRKLTGNDSRIEFLGMVSDEELVELYSNALCVPFVPVHEDFGLVTIEAYRSAKPVITCTDSGEPTYIVKDGKSGFVCIPTERSIAEKIDLLFSRRELAEEMGQCGKSAVNHITWKITVDRLIEELRIGRGKTQ